MPTHVNSLRHSTSRLILGLAASFAATQHSAAQTITDGDVPLLMDAGGTEANPARYIIGENGRYDRTFWEGVHVGWDNSWNSLLVQNGSRVHFDMGLGIGMNYGSSHNSVVVDASELSAYSLSVGLDGENNRLDIRNGGSVRSTTSVISYGNGNALTVSGANSVLEADDFLALGGSGRRLTIENGGSVKVGLTVTIGADIATGGSHVLVTGSGSLLEAGIRDTPSMRALVVGGDASGNSLRVEDGGAVKSYGDITIAERLGSEAEMVVTGAGSSVWGERYLYLGSRPFGLESWGGESKLRIEDGAVVTLGDSVYMGAVTGQDNVLSVSGQGSALNIVSSLSLGISYNEPQIGGSNTLIIEDGGMVRASYVSMFSAHATERNNILVTGDGSLLQVGSDENYGQVSIGSNGSDQTLQVERGGILEVNGTIHIGPSNSTGGELVITDSGSRAEAKSMYIGTNPYLSGAPAPDGSRLRIENGGTVVIEDELRIGKTGEQNNDLIVSGQGSLLDIGGWVWIGEESNLSSSEGSGTNTLTIEDGGVVRVGTTLTMVATGSAESSQVLVTGAGSLLEIVGQQNRVGPSLFIGSSGNGHRVRVKDGGAIEVSGDIAIGTMGASDGELLVSGAGSSVAARNMQLGAALSTPGSSAGNGNTLQIQDGAEVIITESLSIGEWSDQNNHVLVSGRNSVLRVDGNLSVGFGLGMSNNASNILVAEKFALVVAGDLFVNSIEGASDYIRLNGGFIAWYGDNLDGLSELLNNGRIQIWNPETGQWENALGSQYFSYGYFDSDEAALAFSGYEGLGGYTIFTGMIPEPATYAAIVGAVAIGLIAVRRRRMAQVK